ncbi:MAG: hypothetical protein IJC64_01360 [Clostridia bacterium]|nr:hypothetical protein [Clostridia bacterium]
MKNKDRKIEELLSAIGEIDDDLLHEAQTYRVARRISFNVKALAACLAIAFVLAIALPLIRSLEGLNESVPSESAVALDQVMLDLRGGSYHTYSSFDELSYVGKAQLVWQYSDSDEVCALPLTNQQLSRIERAMGKGEATGQSSPELYCKIWVLDGKGNVASPYLKKGAGNVGCEVFDYDAEIIPDESMVECISDIIS